VRCEVKNGVASMAVFSWQWWWRMRSGVHVSDSVDEITLRSPTAIFVILRHHSVYTILLLYYITLFYIS